MKVMTRPGALAVYFRTIWYDRALEHYCLQQDRWCVSLKGIFLGSILDQLNQNFGGPVLRNLFLINFEILCNLTTIQILVLCLLSSAALTHQETKSRSLQGQTHIRYSGETHIQRQSNSEQFGFSNLCVLYYQQKKNCTNNNLLYSFSTLSNCKFLLL